MYINGMKKLITFDFDTTLKFPTGRPNMEFINLMKDFAVKGHTIMIVSTRMNTAENLQDVENFVKNFELPVEKIFLCAGSKVPVLKELMPDMHIDDSEDECEEFKGFIDSVMLVTNWKEEWELFKANDFLPLENQNNDKTI